VKAGLELTRDQILGHRRRVGALDERLPAGAASLERAAWAGLQDSMPRAALLSIHARVSGVGPDTLEDPALVQLWGPRFSAYVVAARDRAVFTLGRLPDDAKGRQRAEQTADRLAAFLADQQMAYGEAGRGQGVFPNSLRYAAPTGRVLMRWDGARQPTIWMVPPPKMEAGEARLELARRYLHVFGPSTPASLAEWAGIRPPAARAAFDALAGELTPVCTAIGDAWILSSDDTSFRSNPSPPASARLLPSGDAYWLLQGADRELLVPHAGSRALLWTPRVWPGALLVDGEICGTWRRAEAKLTIQPWRVLSSAEREAVVMEAESLPLPGVVGGAGRLTNLRIAIN
jgi:hypothetical protein